MPCFAIMSGSVSENPHGSMASRTLLLMSSSNHSYFLSIMYTKAKGYVNCSCKRCKSDCPKGGSRLLDTRQFTIETVCRKCHPLSHRWFPVHLWPNLSVLMPSSYIVLTNSQQTSFRCEPVTSTSWRPTRFHVLFYRIQDEFPYHNAYALLPFWNSGWLRLRNGSPI